MNRIKLDERLYCCAQFVRKDASLCDVGTDHAFLPTYLLENRIIKSAVACDINEKPLESAYRTIHSHNVQNAVTLVCSNGLEKVNPNDFCDLVVAGMGAELIVSILAAAPFLKNESYRLILQPMSKAYTLRKWLCENGFEITEEKACLANGKVYSVIYSRYCEQNFYDEFFFQTGKIANKTDDISKMYLEKVKKALLKQANGILSSNKNDKKAQELLKLTERIKV